MQFAKVNEGGVRRNDGVSIQIKHPEYLEYRDGDAVARVSLGYEPSTRQINVYASEVDTWETSTGLLVMPPSKRVQLVKDLAEGLGLLRGNFVII